MLIPVTDEATWLASLRIRPQWHPPTKPTVVVAPHPDDETLGAGGFIGAQRRRGVPVVVVAVTDGEAAYEESEGLGDIRRAEQERALGELGVHSCDIVRLSLPDSGVAACEKELADFLRPLVGRDTLLIAPWCSDHHPDHEASGRAAREVADHAGATLVSYFFWTWHYERVETLAGLPLHRFELDPYLVSARAAALLHHQSQLVHKSGSPILPESLLSPARRLFETFIVYA